MPEHIESPDRIAALQQEIAQLRHAVTAHAVVDQAMGVVIAYAGVRPETAWAILRDISQHTNTKLREISEHILEWPHCAWLPDEVRHALDAATRSRTLPAGPGTSGARRHLTPS